MKNRFADDPHEPRFPVKGLVGIDGDAVIARTGMDLRRYCLFTGDDCPLPEQGIPLMFPIQWMPNWGTRHRIAELVISAAVIILLTIFPGLRVASLYFLGRHVVRSLPLVYPKWYRAVSNISWEGRRPFRKQKILVLCCAILSIPAAWLSVMYVLTLFLPSSHPLPPNFVIPNQLTYAIAALLALFAEGMMPRPSVQRIDEDLFRIRGLEAPLVQSLRDEADAYRTNQG